MRAPFTFEGAAAAAGPLLDQGGFTAVFCDDDILAGGVYLAARERGIEIPGDLSVVGFDDLDFARVLAPPLTTVAVDAEGLGAAAFEALGARPGRRAAVRGAGHAGLARGPRVDRAAAAKRRSATRAAGHADALDGVDRVIRSTLIRMNLRSRNSPPSCWRCSRARRWRPHSRRPPRTTEPKVALVVAGQAATQPARPGRAREAADADTDAQLRVVPTAAEELGVTHLLAAQPTTTRSITTVSIAGSPSIRSPRATRRLASSKPPQRD